MRKIPGLFLGHVILGVTRQLVGEPVLGYMGVAQGLDLVMLQSDLGVCGWGYADMEIMTPLSHVSCMRLFMTP